MVLIPSVPSKAALIAVPAILYAIAFSLFISRIYARFKAKLVAADDYLLAIGVLFATGLLADFELVVANGLGRHHKELSMHQIFIITKASFFLGQLYVASITFVKISLAWQLLRLKGASKLWRIGLWALVSVTVGVFIASEVIAYTACRPLRAVWDFAIKGSEVFSSCVSTGPGVFVTTGEYPPTAAD